MYADARLQTCCFHRTIDACDLIEPAVTEDIVTVITGSVNKFFAPCVKSLFLKQHLKNYTKSINHVQSRAMDLS
jgi:hypothetical protein